MSKLRTCLVVFIFSFIAFSGCKQQVDDSIPIDINGIWSLSTIQGISAASAGSSSTLTIVNSTSFTQQMTIGTTVGSPYNGTVTKVTDTVYNLLADGGTTSDSYSISSDGHTLSCNHQFFGIITYTK